MSEQERAPSARDDRDQDIHDLKDFIERWSTFSITAADSPGPLYTAGANAILSVIKAEATARLADIETMARELEYLRDDHELYGSPCGRC